MTNKTGEIQKLIEKALMILQSSSSPDEELAEIKKAIAPHRIEAYRYIKKSLRKASQKELINIFILISILEEDAFMPLLKKVFYRKDINLSLKEKIVKLLEKFNSPLSPQLVEELANSQSLYEKLLSAIKKGESKNIKKNDLQELLEFSEPFQLSLLEQLINETREKSLPLADKLFGLSGGLDEFLIDKLSEIESKQSAAILGKWLEQSDNKFQKKLIKKSLYKLKLKGIKPKPTAAKAEPLKLEVPAEISAYASHIDAQGERFLLLAREQPHIGLKVFQVFLSDEKGIFKIDTGEMRGRDFRRLLRKMEDENRIMLIQIEPDYCHFLLDEAAQINKSSKNPLPENYNAFKNWLNEPKKEYTRPLIYSALSIESIKNKKELMEQSARLLQIDPFRGWSLPAEELEKPVQQFKDAVDSRILLTPIQQQERLAAIYVSVAEHYFSSKRAKQYRRHLEEMAYVLLIKGKKNEARIALATAIALEEQAPPFIPFIIELVKRSIFFKAGIAPKAELERTKKEDSSIILPARERASEKKESARIVPSEGSSQLEREEDSGLIIPPGDLKRE
jgi:hypothetical protein